MNIQSGTRLYVFGADYPTPSYWDGYATVTELTKAGPDGTFDGQYVGKGTKVVVLNVPRPHDVEYLQGRLASGLYGTRVP